jgi:predicted MFS family arabinose efflux permease
MTARGSLSEGRLLLLIGAVQFVNILDFMMVMPLGPDFARDLGIPTARLGIIGGAYTAAAALSGVVGASFLDRFDRRKALLWALLGLVFGTALGGFARGLGSLIAARVVAGLFGGPATALALSVIADVVPLERRGRAMGAVMGAFSVASVLGVPLGLELARLGGWQLPFFAVAALGAVVGMAARLMLPAMTSHLARHGAPRGSMLALLARPVVLLSLAGTVAIMMGNFAIIPNLSTYFQLNRGYPRAELGFLYLLGGAVSFGTLRISGRLTDRVGPARGATLGTLLFVLVLAVGFIWPLPALPVLLVFVGFMVTGSFRFVPMQALSSRVPAPEERASFMSLQSCVQHLASALGALLGARLLETRSDGGLVGMERVAGVAAALALALPVLMFAVEARVLAGERARSSARVPERGSEPAVDISS